MSEGNQKVEQLKGTISDLRASLEKKDTEKEIELEQNSARFNQEILQLKKTLSVREHFDNERIQVEDRIQSVRAKSQSEIRNLKETISFLRERLKKVKMIMMFEYKKLFRHLRLRFHN